MKEDCSALILELTGKNTVTGCKACDTLYELSQTSNELYQYMDQFLTLIENSNSYVRTRGLVLIVANAKYDINNKIDENIDRILAHLTDPKPITSRQFIQVLPELAISKPYLKEYTLRALRTADTQKYADSMKPLVDKDISVAYNKISCSL